LKYVTNQATRIIIKAIGELGIPNEPWLPKADSIEHADMEEDPDSMQQIILEGSDGAKEIDYQSYRPKIVGNEWILSETDLCEYTRTAILWFSTLLVQSSSRKDAESLGQFVSIDVPVILETHILQGGGGDPYPTYLKTRQMLRDGKELRIVDHSSLPNDAVLARGGTRFFGKN
jgi:hypothetical protein